MSQLIDVHFFLELPTDKSKEALQLWLNDFAEPMASKIVPYFKSNRQSPELIFFDDEGHNEALHTFQFLTLFQLLREGIRVGDGELVLQLYKPCLPIFDLYARTKYRFVHHQNSSLSSCELTLPLSLSLSFLLSTRLDVVIALALKKAVLSKYDAFDFTWNRFANTRGKADSNIPLDLLMEHRIREAKERKRRRAKKSSKKAGSMSVSTMRV